MRYLVAAMFILVVAFLLWLTCSDKITDAMRQDAGISKDTSAAIKTDSVIAQDGNVYRTLTFGDQTWTIENLRRTDSPCGDSLRLKFANGADPGPNVEFYDLAPRYAYLHNRKNDVYGVLYNYAAVSSCELCMPGFRVSTKADWERLVAFLGGSVSFGKAILPAKDSRFGTQMAGRIDNYDGSMFEGEFEFWWTPDTIAPRGEPVAYAAEINKRGLFKLKPQAGRMGAYIRCVKE